MSNVKDISDILTLLTKLGDSAVQLKKAGSLGNIMVDIEIAKALYAPLSVVIAEAPTMALELPKEVGSMDLATAQLLLGQVVALGHAWAGLFQTQA